MSVICVCAIREDSKQTNKNSNNILEAALVCFWFLSVNITIEGFKR
jgi:hypothetical protein